MSDEALGLIQRAAGLRSEKPLSDRRGFAPSKAWDELEDTGHAAEPPPSSTTENEDVSPAGIFRVAWRYKFTLVGMTLLLIALAAAVILAMPSIYVPEALIVVGNREASSPQLRTGTDSFPPLADTATVQTEMEILR